MSKINRAMMAGAVLAAGFFSPAVAAGVDLENTIYMDLKCGRVTIKLYKAVSPKHVARIKKLTREKFYDGIIFHRVIDGFMAQTGDPTGTGTGRSKYPNVPAEFNRIPFERGTVGMARSSLPDSANSQFFIMFKQGHFLNGQYTVWGQVTSGMSCVDKLNKGEPPASPDKIIRMRVAKDAG